MHAHTARHAPIGWGTTRAVAIVLVAVCSVGCRPRTGSRRRAPKLVHTPAHGRPDTCPDRAVDPFGDGTPAPDDQRCSYADLPGGKVVKLQGQVMTAPQGATPGEPVEGAEIVVYAVEADGRRREVARTRADAQGSFTVGAMLPEGEYAVGVADQPATAVRLRVADADPDPVRVIVP